LSHAEPDHLVDDDEARSPTGSPVPLKYIPGGAKRKPNFQSTRIDAPTEPQQQDADSGITRSSAHSPLPFKSIPGGAKRKPQIQATPIGLSPEPQRQEDDITQHSHGSEISGSMQNSTRPASQSGSVTSDLFGLRRAGGRLRDKMRSSTSRVGNGSGSRLRQDASPSRPSPLSRELSQDSTGSQETIHTVEEKFHQACHKLHCLLEDALSGAQLAATVEDRRRDAAHQDLPHGCHRYARRKREGWLAGQSLGGHTRGAATDEDGDSVPLLPYDRSVTPRDDVPHDNKGPHRCLMPGVHHGSLRVIVPQRFSSLQGGRATETTTAYAAKAVATNKVKRRAEA